MSTNIFTVASYITDQIGEVTCMKLQKLCYYAQAWSLAWDDVPIFEEDFQAWPCGPVCQELYNIHEGEYTISSDKLKQFKDSHYEFTNSEIETLSVVMEDYASIEPYGLSELTHSERPWRETRYGLKFGDPCTKVIPKILMQEYYTGLLGND